MKGDRYKSESAFSRWVEYFTDGKFTRTRKGKWAIPSPCSQGKEYNRRWLRRQMKESIEEQIEGR